MQKSHEPKAHKDRVLISPPSSLLYVGKAFPWLAISKRGRLNNHLFWGRGGLL